MKTRTPIQRSWWAGGPRGLALAALLSLLLLAVACDSSGPPAGSQALFPAEDGLLLHGRVFGNGAPGVILSHAYRSDQKSWADFAERLAARGFLVLTFDFRGHGVSPGDREVGIADADVTAALKYMRALGRTRVFLVGASMGGTASLKVAAREEVLGVVTLSAPDSFMGLTALTDAQRVQAPKLFLGAEGDTAAAQSAQALFAIAPDPKELKLFAGVGHGTELIEGAQGQTVRDHIIQFLQTHN